MCKKPGDTANLTPRAIARLSLHSNCNASQHLTSCKEVTLLIHGRQDIYTKVEESLRYLYQLEVNDPGQIILNHDENFGPPFYRTTLRYRIIPNAAFGRVSSKILASITKVGSIDAELRTLPKDPHCHCIGYPIPTHSPKQDRAIRV